MSQDRNANFASPDDVIERGSVFPRDTPCWGNSTWTATTTTTTTAAALLLPGPMLGAAVKEGAIRVCGLYVQYRTYVRVVRCGYPSGFA